ncbi:hypothetical protein AVEN_201475-1 [Araneus ventricosus]|uniref:Uncharacterized protein n=1 Tax=Araneus ventricosus TaxID=182803 RepID=A0A4Y2QDZ7_ARAVE|nr:hypothetical protein AVEN_201475-1 [Araneus ventricosus]
MRYGSQWCSDDKCLSGQNMSSSSAVVITQIAILLCSKVAEILLCMFAASLTQQESKFETSYCKRRNHRSASLSRQTIAKTEYAAEPPTSLFLSCRFRHSASQTSIAEDRLC